MSELRLPGQQPNNPLVTLAQAVAVSNTHLAVIAANTKPEQRHIYALAERVDDEWGAYCLACSEAEHEYIYPCAKYPDRPAPPNVITEISDAQYWTSAREVEDVPLPE